MKGELSEATRIRVGRRASLRSPSISIASHQPAVGVFLPPSPLLYFFP